MGRLLMGLRFMRLKKRLKFCLGKLERNQNSENTDWETKKDITDHSTTDHTAGF